MVMSAAAAGLSQPIRFVDLLQPEDFNLKYSVLLQFESCLVMAIYYQTEILSDWTKSRLGRVMSEASQVKSMS